MNRSIRQRMGALAGVLLAGTVVLAWASPASAVHNLGSQATFGGTTVTCEGPQDAQQQFGLSSGNVTGNIQCGVNANLSSAAQVTGTFSGGTYKIQCSYATNPNGGPPILLYQETINNVVVVNDVGRSAGSRVFDGVTVSVACGPAADAYPLAVGARAASEAASPALVTQPAADDSSGRGTTWLLLAGAAALLVVVGQLAMGRRIGRRRSQATD